MQRFKTEGSRKMCPTAAPTMIECRAQLNAIEWVTNSTTRPILVKFPGTSEASSVIMSSERNVVTIQYNLQSKV